MSQRILVVQPERKHQLTLAQLFEDRGDVVITAVSLKEVGTIVNRYKPDKIVLDVQMLGENWDRAIPVMERAAPESQFVLTSNGDSSGVFKRNKQFKDWGVITPPFSNAKIERALTFERNGVDPDQEQEPKKKGLFTNFRFPIRYKITFPYIALALALAAAGAYLVTNVVLDTIEERFTNQLIETGRLTAEWMVKEEDRLLETLRLVSHTEGIPEAVLAKDPEQLREIVLPIAINGQIESVEILDLNAVSLLSLRQQAAGDFEDYVASRGDTAYQNWSFVQQVLLGEVDQQGDKYAGVALAPWGNFFYITGPIRDLQGQLLGVAMIGETLPSLTTGIREATLAQSTLYDFEGQPLATTFIEDTGPLGSNLVSGVMQRQEQESYKRDLTVANIEYTEILGTLEARGGSDVALVGTSLPQTFLVQPSQVTRLQIFGLATVAFIFVISAGVLIADRITRPLLQVVEASAEVAHGNLTVKLPTGGNDELNTLANAFNDMVSALEKSNRELIDAYNSTLEGWSKALEMRDEETEGHTQRVTDMTVRLARRMGISDDELIQIKRGALLHDIGKMGVPDGILNKPGPLSEEEWEVMRKHPIFAYQMLSPIAYLRPALAIPCCHHERWDGSGYPLGWRAQDIPLPARIFAVVDVWDALRSDRPYRKSWPDERVLEHLEAHKGVHFDPQVVDEFVRMIKLEGVDGAVAMRTPAIHQTLLRRTVPFG